MRRLAAEPWCRESALPLACWQVAHPILGRTAPDPQPPVRLARLLRDAFSKRTGEKPASKTGGLTPLDD